MALDEGESNSKEDDSGSEKSAIPIDIEPSPPPQTPLFIEPASMPIIE